MTSFSSLPRLLGASVGFVLAALAASAFSTGVGSMLALDVGDEGPVDEDADADDDDAEDDAGANAGDDDDDPDAANVSIRGPARTHLAKSIVQHNPFCADCRATAQLQARAPSQRRLGPTPTQLPLELVATMVATPAEESIAIIAHSQTEHSAPFRPHEHVRDDVVVERITRTRVILDHAGQLEFLDLNGRYCTTDDPCEEGMGNCEADAQCLPGLVCGQGLGELYRHPPNYAVCVPAACAASSRKPMSKSTCSSTCRCPSGMGDCDETEDCLPGHVCVSNNGPAFGKPANWDICVAEHCTNGRRDADETGVDCGGSRCGTCL